MLVEPSAVQSRVIVNAFRNAGIHHFEVVHDGNSALQLLAQFHPDLVVSAMYLPDMTASDLVNASNRHLSVLPPSKERQLLMDIGEFFVTRSF